MTKFDEETSVRKIFEFMIDCHIGGELDCVYFAPALSACDVANRLLLI